MSEISPTEPLEVPSDPIAVAVMAPVASARNQILIYGAEDSGQGDTGSLVEESLSLLGDSPAIVVSE